ncbi:MAG: hypothetical protein H6728_11860 [Myxococcales bacterium]|nr:hypothetical protein [Myxococcales bacterium]
MKWVFRSMIFSVLCSVVFGACGSSRGTYFGETICQKAFTCKPEATAPEEQKVQFTNYFGSNDQVFCVKLWVSRLDDPLGHGNAKCASSTELQLNTCLEEVAKTTDCSSFRALLTTSCKVCEL